MFYSFNKAPFWPTGKEDAHPEIFAKNHILFENQTLVVNGKSHVVKAVVRKIADDNLWTWTIAGSTPPVHYVVGPKLFASKELALESLLSFLKNPSHKWSKRKGFF